MSMNIGMRNLPYKDSTLKLSVGESAFENWFANHPQADKQAARDAYAAGMGDPLVTYANQEILNEL